MNEKAKIKSGLLYASLLLGQTMAALFLFWRAFPIFSWLVTHLGERQNLVFGEQIEIALSALLLHGLYWARLRWVADPRAAKEVDATPVLHRERARIEAASRARCLSTSRRRR